MNRPILTLKQVFLLSLLSLFILLGLLFGVLLHGSRNSILNTSERLRREVGLRLKNQVVEFRDQATEVAGDVETDFKHGLIKTTDRDGLEKAFYSLVLNHPNIAEVTFSHADKIGDDGESLRFAPKGHWQVSVYRGGSDDPGEILSRRVEFGGPDLGFQAEIRRLHGYVGASTPGTQPTTEPALDPADHLTFRSLVLDVNLHTLVWSDLHPSELALTGNDHTGRIEVTVQESLFNGDTFLGVVRVGLLQSQLDEIINAQNANQPSSLTGDDPNSVGNMRHEVFLCDTNGRLVTPVTRNDQHVLEGDDIRIQSPNMPPEIAGALNMLVRDLTQVVGDSDRFLKPGKDGGRVAVGDKGYLVTFLSLENTQGWVLGVIGSEADYLGPLVQTQHQLLMDGVIVMAAILFGGAMTLRAVQRGLARIIALTSRMREFDFSPSVPEAPFRDVRAVMESLEQAKTAMRAMGKYVPMDLVRDLYHMNREPALGGELRELSIMFTDIKGFTDLSENMPPDVLAVALGRYLQVMTAAIHEQSGTIDKFIGDSVMALWNAPAPCADHPARACAAALACSRATRRLFASADWKDLPPLITRCGIHRDRVMIGHFGAPDRLNYTALGDGVNLASRLESLNKQYGSQIIVSEAIWEQAGAAFHFRLLDRVAVKGKKQAVKVYELLGTTDELSLELAVAKVYELALDAYWKRDFAGAIQILETQPSDAPSANLAERCRKLIDDPPPPDWDGTYISMMK